MPPPRPHARPVQALAAGGLALLGLATSACAQIIPTGAPAADILLTRALSEQRVFLTCSALDAEGHRAIRAAWERDVTAATAVLVSAAVPADAIAAFAKSATVKALLPDPETPWSEVKQFCDTYPDWQADRAGPAVTSLAQKLAPVFE